MNKIKRALAQAKFNIKRARDRAAGTTDFLATTLDACVGIAIVLVTLVVVIVLAVLTFFSPELTFGTLAVLVLARIGYAAVKGK